MGSEQLPPRLLSIYSFYVKITMNRIVNRGEQHGGSDARAGPQPWDLVLERVRGRDNLG